jgi:hypothetical protein
MKRNSGRHRNPVQRNRIRRSNRRRNVRAGLQGGLARVARRGKDAKNGKHHGPGFAGIPQGASNFGVCVRETRGGKGIEIEKYY